MEKSPTVLARLNNSPKVWGQAGKIAKRIIGFAGKYNDTVKDDIQLYLKLIENGGFTAFFDTLIRESILPVLEGRTDDHVWSSLGP
jgi:hypothetical protein